MTTLTDRKICFISNVDKIVNYSYILLNTSQFANLYRSSIEHSLIAYNLYFHKLPPFKLRHIDDPDGPDFPDEVCSICDIHINALVHPRNYMNADEYCETYCVCYDVTYEQFHASRLVHTTLS